jgi:hypothetical protein
LELATPLKNFTNGKRLLMIGPYVLQAALAAIFIMTLIHSD